MTFKDTLELWLKNRATTDAEFAKDFAKESKSVDNCCKYIEAMLLKQVLKQRKANKDNSRCCAAAPSDDEVFAMALEYYHNDDIKLEPQTTGDMVKILSMSAVSFTDSEKEQMRKEAKEWFISSEKAKLAKEKKDGKVTCKADVKPTTPNKTEPKQVTMKPTAKPVKNSKGEQATQLSLF